MQTVDGQFEISVDAQSNAIAPDTVLPDTVLLNIRSADDNSFFLELQLSKETAERLVAGLIEKVRTT